MIHVVHVVAWPSGCWCVARRHLAVALVLRVVWLQLMMEQTRAHRGGGIADAIGVDKTRVGFSFIVVLVDVGLVKKSSIFVSN